MKPSYLDLSKKELQKRAEKAWGLLNPCRVCPRRCEVDRIRNKRSGFCQIGVKPQISSYYPHFGEEKPLVGIYGSGTIFFSSCNLACVYCQNFEISQLKKGNEIEIEDLSKIMLFLQKKGCHNINFVSPSIWVPQIIKAVLLAIKKGLKIPLIYNTGGYDSTESLRLLEKIIDIYLPDMKYSDSKIGARYSLVANYWEVNKMAVREMFRQVGDLKINKKGLAEKGLLIRHLILPEDLAGTKKIMKFIASLSKNSYVNIMDQYYPTNKANLYPKINRRILPEEFQNAINLAKESGLHRFESHL